MPARTIAILFAFLFLVIAARERIERGGPLLARTIASKAGSNPRNSEETMLLYELATKAIPRNATIVVVKPLNRADDHQVNRVSHGQLPYHRVVPQDRLTTDPPDFVITLGAPLDDPRYERMHESPAGGIWRRVRW